MRFAILSGNTPLNLVFVRYIRRTLVKSPILAGNGQVRFGLLDITKSVRYEKSPTEAGNVPDRLLPLPLVLQSLAHAAVRLRQICDTYC